MLDGTLLATDYAPIVSGIFALLGSAIGVSVALLLARRAREEERRIWLNDQRQAVYPKFVAAGQAVLDACDELQYVDVVRSVAVDRLQQGYRELVVHNAVIQTLGGRSTIKAARCHMYTLIALRDIRLGRNPDPDPDRDPNKLDELSRGGRKSRHQAIVAMRYELGVPDTDGLLEELDLPIKPLRVAAPAGNAQTP
jgi:hypothetical protein